MIVVRPGVELDVTRLSIVPRGHDVPFVAEAGTATIALTAALATRGTPSYEGNFDAWRRRCGIPRPSSAARPCVAAAVACRVLIEPGQVEPEQLGIATVSTTSATAMAVKFETRGLVEGWSSVDPLLLPSTLLSALSTQVAAAVGAKAFATSFVVGLLGFFHALEAAVHGLTRGDAHVVLVVAADEHTEVQRKAHERLGWASPPEELVGALAVERGANRGARLAFVAYGESPGEVIPSGWEAARCHDVHSMFPEPSVGSAALLTALAEALTSGASRVVVRTTVPGIGSASVGFESHR